MVQPISALQRYLCSESCASTMVYMKISSSRVAIDRSSAQLTIHHDRSLAARLMVVLNWGSRNTVALSKYASKIFLSPDPVNGLRPNEAPRDCL